MHFINALVALLDAYIEQVNREQEQTGSHEIPW